MLQAFPEALFHQLLLAMVHPDHETRVGAHRIFSVVLVPSSVCPRTKTEQSTGYAFRRTLSKTVSVFSSSSALFEKLRRAQSDDFTVPNSNDNGDLYRLNSSKSRVYSMKNPDFTGIVNKNADTNLSKGMVSACLSYVYEIQSSCG